MNSAVPAQDLASGSRNDWLAASAILRAADILLRLNQQAWVPAACLRLGRPPLKSAYLSTYPCFKYVLRSELERLSVS